MATLAVDVNLLLEDAADADLEAWAARLPPLGVATAWVTPGQACRADPESFDALPGVHGGAGTVHVLPVLVPPAGRAGALERAVGLAASARCRAVRVCPTGHGYPLVDWALSPLPELCARERMCMLVDFGASDLPWDEVVAFARAFPALPVVVLGAAVDADRVVPAVLDVTANVLLELSRLEGVAQLVGLADLYGAHRFVWGSAGTRAGLEMGSELGRAAELDEETREAVLGGNARALGDGTYAAAFL